MSLIDAKLASYTSDLKCLTVAADSVLKEIRRTRRAIEKGKMKLIDILEKLEKSKQTLAVMDQTLEKKGEKLKARADNLLNKDLTMVTKEDLFLGVYKILEAQNQVVHMKHVRDYISTLNQLKEKWSGIEATETEKLHKLITIEREIRRQIELRRQAQDVSDQSRAHPESLGAQNPTNMDK